MIKLNILSNEIKRELKLVKILKSFNALLLFVFVNVLIYTGILLGSFLFLNYNYSLLVDEANSMNKDTEVYSLKAEKVNNIVNEISKIQSDFTAWSDYLDYFSNQVNTGITIDKISIDKTNNSISIIGKAKERNNLLSFRDALLETETYKDFELPIKNLLVKEDISFDIKTEFLHYEFK